MKKLLMLISLSVLLVSCSSTEDKIKSVNSGYIEIEVEDVKEEHIKNSFFVENTLGVPNYINIDSCIISSGIDTTVLFDWIEKTGIKVEDNNYLTIDLKEEESITEIEIIGFNIKKLTLSAEGYFESFEYNNETEVWILDIKNELITDKIEIIVNTLEKEKTELFEIHISGDKKIDENKLAEYEKNNELKNDISDNYLWTNDVYENIHIVEEIINDYKYIELENIFEELDLSLLEENLDDFIGSPIFIRGKVLKIEENYHKQFLIIESIYSSDIFEVFCGEEVEVNSIVNINGFILGQNKNNIIIYGVK